MTQKHAHPENRAPRWASLTAGDIMQTRIITVSDSAPLSEVERILTENRITGVPVTNQAGRVVGVISVKDLLDRYVEDPDSRPRRGRGFYHQSSEELDDVDFESFELPDEGEDTAASVMNAEVFHVPTTLPVAEVARKMVSHGIHRVLVTDAESHQVVGIITSMGILAAVSA